jgi:hypothetical protein
MKSELVNLSPIMLLVLVTLYFEQVDTCGIKLLIGTYMNGKMPYPTKVKGKFKYYP